MKTSSSQFETMVNFMKRQGDLNKPQKTAKERIQNIESWTQLTELLNSDPTGEKKTTEKWKKVWSDLKNNTKKKAAKLDKAASGGPALCSKLSEIENLVLNICGVRASTGFSHVVKVEYNQEHGDSYLTPMPSLLVYERESRLPSDKDEKYSSNDPLAQSKWHTPEPSQLSDTVREDDLSSDNMQVLTDDSASKTPPVMPGTSYVPAHNGHIFRRRRGLPSQSGIGSKRSVTRPRSNLDKVVEHLINSEKEWKKFVQRKHLDDTNLERERLRIRELELRMQQKWVDIATRAILVVNKVIEKNLCNECEK